METPYLAFFGIADCLTRLLLQQAGPDVVIILTRASHGYFEKVVMGGNRYRLIRRLKRADRYGRLKVMYPVVPKADGGEQDVLIRLVSGPGSRFPRSRSQRKLSPEQNGVCRDARAPAMRGSVPE